MTTIFEFEQKLNGIFKQLIDHLQVENSKEINFDILNKESAKLKVIINDLKNSQYPLTLVGINEYENKFRFLIIRFIIKVNFSEECIIQQIKHFSESLLNEFSSDSLLVATASRSNSQQKQYSQLSKFFSSKKNPIQQEKHYENINRWHIEMYNDQYLEIIKNIKEIKQEIDQQSFQLVQLNNDDQDSHLKQYSNIRLVKMLMNEQNYIQNQIKQIFNTINKLDYEYQLSKIYYFENQLKTIQQSKDLQYFLKYVVIVDKLITVLQDSVLQLQQYVNNSEESTDYVNSSKKSYSDLKINNTNKQQNNVLLESGQNQQKYYSLLKNDSLFSSPKKEEPLKSWNKNCQSIDQQNNGNDYQIKEIKQSDNNHKNENVCISCSLF